MARHFDEALGMYRQFEPIDRIFVDREEYIDWMQDALKRCKEKSIILHLHGIGGIGKSSLLNHWNSTIPTAIHLDCAHYTEFYDRLNILAKEAVQLGIRLQRFDVLWQVRQRFVVGVEPTREEGREWAKEVVMAIPFIGSLASIGSAISAVGGKVAPKLKGKYGKIGKWLQEQLGKNHVERLLEILWKEPRHAEFLFLDSLLEDLNDRENLDTPLLFLFDNSEHVDAEEARWGYAGKQITESELWRVFVSSVTNCVGVLAARRALKVQDTTHEEVSELIELDRESCLELLQLRNITNSELQDRIVSVSGGNPFVIGTLCDLAASRKLSLSTVESLRSETLEDVRLKTWRKLFSQVEDLQLLTNRAGLLPFFDKGVMNIISIDMTSDQWDRLIRLSFIKDRNDGTFVLHDLARDLVISELEDRLPTLAAEVEELLETTSEIKSDAKLLGLSISVKGLHTLEDALEKVMFLAENYSWRFQFRSAVEFLDAVKFEPLRERTIVSSFKAWHLTFLDRIAEAEHLFSDAIEILRELAEENPEQNLAFLVDCLNSYGVLMERTDRPIEAEEFIEESLEVSKAVDVSASIPRHIVAGSHWWAGHFFRRQHKLKRSLEALNYSLELTKSEKDSLRLSRQQSFTMHHIGATLVIAGEYLEAEKICEMALETWVEDVNKLNTFRTLGDIYRLTSRIEEAEKSYRESLDTINKISQREPGVYQVQPGYFRARLAHALKLMNRFEEAEALYLKALPMARESIDYAPQVWRPLLSLLLNDLAILYHQTGRDIEAKVTFEESLEHSEKLCTLWPERYLGLKAWTLNNYSVHLCKRGSLDSERYYNKSLVIARELSEQFPEPIFHKHLTGTILNNFGVLLRKVGKDSEAETVFREALVIRSKLVDRSPDVFNMHLATTLNNVGVLYATTQRLVESQDSLCKALEIRRELVEKSPDMHLISLSYILNNIGNLCNLKSETKQADAYYNESLEILNELSSKAPTVYLDDLIRVLGNSALHLSTTSADKKVERLRTKLKDLGVDELPNTLLWLEEETTVPAPL
jgi:tetratricopeptide (TPR) repeat protein